MDGKLRRVIMLATVALACSAALGAEAAREEGKQNPAATAKPYNGILRNDIWMTLHRRYSGAARKGGLGLVFIGDSITFLWDTNGKAVWKKYYGARKAAQFGIAADRTESVLWRTENGNLELAKPKLFVLLIGTNNLQTGRKCTGEEIAGGITAIVENLKKKCPESNILVMGIFPRSNPAAEQARLTREIAKANELIKKLDDGKLVHVRDIGAEFLNQEGKVDGSLIYDGVHLSGAGYEKWAAAIEPDVSRILGDKAGGGEQAPPAAEPKKE